MPKLTVKDPLESKDACQIAFVQIAGGGEARAAGKAGMNDRIVEIEKTRKIFGPWADEAMVTLREESIGKARLSGG